MGAVLTGAAPFPEFEEEPVKVQMVVQISGARDGADWPAPGGILEVPELEAAELVANGFAKVPEGKSVLAEPEKATARKQPETRKRGLTKDSLG